MVPYVFVSSTIDDLHHLRDALRDAILELAYHPVLSEYGDVGYSPAKSAVDSCYQTMRECQIAVLIIGKRYGTIMEDGRSVTHSEFLAARQAQVPVICLVDRDIVTFKKVYDNNRGVPIGLPGMDAPERTFALIDEITRSAANNAVLGFLTVSEARGLLKGQLAHMTGEFLRRGQDPVKADVRDVLAEIKTLRHEMTAGTDKRAPLFMKAIRYLLDEANVEYRETVEILFETIEAGVADLLQHEHFHEVVVSAVGSAPQILPYDTWSQIESYLTTNDANLYWYMTGTDEQPDEASSAFIAVDLSRTHAYLNRRMNDAAEEWHQEFRKYVSAA